MFQYKDQAVVQTQIHIEHVDIFAKMKMLFLLAF